MLANKVVKLVHVTVEHQIVEIGDFVTTHLFSQTEMHFLLHHHASLLDIKGRFPTTEKLPLTYLFQQQNFSMFGGESFEKRPLQQPYLDPNASTFSLNREPDTVLSILYLQLVG